MKESRIPLEAKGLPLGLLAAALFSAPLQAAGPRFQLVTEKWVNQSSGGAGTGTFTAHLYDASGNRTRTEIYVGLDGAGDLFEKRVFSYNAAGLLESQTNYYGDDLDSRIVHSYDAQSRLSSKVVTGADGSERFRDTYAYDGQGRLADETRWKGASRSSMHRYSYAMDGSLASDTLYEPEGSTLVSVQAILHQGSGRLAGERRESRHRRQNGAWYHVQDIFRLIANGAPAYAVTYQVGGKRADSTAYGYDEHGNRIFEDRFTGAGLPLSRLALSWRDLQSNSIRPLARRGGQGPLRPMLLLSGRDGTGWRHLGADLIGRGPKTFTARLGG